MRPPWLTVGAIAGSNAAPIRAPIWRLVLIGALIKVLVAFFLVFCMPISNSRPCAMSHL